MLPVLQDILQHLLREDSHRRGHLRSTVRTTRGSNLRCGLVHARNARVTVHEVQAWTDDRVAIIRVADRAQNFMFAGEPQPRNFLSKRYQFFLSARCVRVRIVCVVI